MATPPTVLFRCPHNALRSVIAAAFFNQQANGVAHGESAGTEPDDRVNERTITVLREVGIEVGDEKPGQLTPEQLRRADRVISLGCPLEPGLAAIAAGKIEEWPMPDTAGKPVDAVRLGFGGPAALVGSMHRDLVERRRWLDEDTYRLALGLAQIMPGPLAAQTAIGYFQAGVLGATLVGVAFVVPSFLMVIVLSMAYVAYGGLWWMQALFYGIGATVIAIIAIAAYKLARSTNKADPLLWAIFAVLVIATAWFGAELAELFLIAGLLVLIVRAWPGWRRALAVGLACVLLGLAARVMDEWSRGSTPGEGDVLLQIVLFFAKAGSFVFGSGLAGLVIWPLVGGGR